MFPTSTITPNTTEHIPARTAEIILAFLTAGLTQIFPDLVRRHYPECGVIVGEYQFLSVSFSVLLTLSFVGFKCLTNTSTYTFLADAALSYQADSQEKLTYPVKEDGLEPG